MKEIFDAVNQVFDFVVPIADFLWGFPTNFDWYASIPILGKFVLCHCHPHWLWYLFQH